jgi:hypothetical protein
VDRVEDLGCDPLGFLAVDVGVGQDLVSAWRAPACVAKIERN